jgi:hypothetical protein
MAYSYLSLPQPKRPSLARAAGVSSVYSPPLNRQAYAPGTPPPDYNQQVAQTMGALPAPQFAAGTPNAQSTSPFTFSNQGQQAFAPVQTPSLGPASFNGVSVDYSQDPILQQATAAIQAQTQQAEAAALANERQSLIRYGSGDLLRQVLGGKASESDIAAADKNTYGTVQELGRWNNRALSGIDTAANRNNLYFSSTRQRDRGLQQEDFGRQQTRTANQLQDVLTGIAQGLLAAKQQAQQQLLGAEESAYNRALQLAMAQAYYGAGAQAAMNPFDPGVDGAAALSQPAGYAPWDMTDTGAWWPPGGVQPAGYAAWDMTDPGARRRRGGV